MLNRILVVMCSLTLLATGYLSLSVMVRRPPRLNYGAWVLIAGLFVAQSGLTVAGLTGIRRSGWIRGLLLAGAVALVSVGAWWVRETLSGSHFEGYALVLGSLVAAQGAVTLLRLLQCDEFRIAARPH